MAKPKKRAEWMAPVELLRLRDGTEVARYSDDMGPKELRQHVEVETTDLREKSPTTGRLELRKVRKTVDALDMMHRAKSISDGMLKAGREFQTDFDMAHLDPSRAADYGRLPGGGSRVEADAVLRAKDRVWKALWRMGGPSSPLGQAAWWVLGAGLNVENFARRQRWGSGGHMNKKTAAGLVIGVLSVLAGEG